MALVILGCALGVTQHASGNYEMARETQPDAPAGRVLAATIGGGNPLIAPGILVVAAVLSVAATSSARAVRSGEHTAG